MEDVKSHVKYKIFDSLKPLYRDTEEAKRLIKASSLSPNIQDSFGCPLLIKAIQADNCEFISWLLKEGADVNCRDTDYSTPLHHAVLRPICFSITGLLLSNGADVNGVTRYGETPYDWVYQNIHNDGRAFDMCEFLIKKGANVSTFKRSILKIRKFLHAC
ncbi:MAG: ankyrin repeat domain-containing protein [Saprospiraceae bacterium]|nr:ankyrin repeat domain-containing protein [Saprospiraceae bacterium]